MIRADIERLELGRGHAGLSMQDLWLRYYSIGGDADEQQLAAILEGVAPLDLSSHEYDVIAHAINERFTEQGRDHPIPYAEDL